MFVLARNTLLVPLWIAMLCSSCANAAEARQNAQTAIDVVDKTGAPAYDTVRLLCTTAQWQIARGEGTADERTERVHALRAKCHGVYDSFEKLIVAKNAAQSALDAAATVEAMLKVVQAKDLMADALKRAAELHALLPKPADPTDRGAP
jgi:hypothetical protein